jgi:hypothetical protein
MSANVRPSKRVVEVSEGSSLAISVMYGQLAVQGCVVADVDIVHSTSLGDDVFLEGDCCSSRQNSITIDQGREEPKQGGRGL